MDIKISDSAVERFVSDYSEAAGVTPDRFVENVLVSEMARIARLEAQDSPVYDLPYLSKSDGVVMTGYQLFSFLLALHQANSIPTMDPAEREKAVQEHQARLDKDKAIRELFKQYVHDGLIPEDYYGSPATACSWVHDFAEGDITREQLDARFEAAAKRRR